ncbi:hypothetical protein LTR83_000506 [Exophiala xenobiotica]|nr:hypothetical protein LTR90_000506 [Exophiala xenobiotica]KAK5500812.1 hypothetical protein LTR26_000504 [Exophiala xenobiotica]KAK5505954.1 hypothetical protein LTR83_000506 [Exophiala xenobiotica]KAK5522658.1 hypothetical protein LTR21_000505 [Exophiala xenobiotica]
MCIPQAYHHRVRYNSAVFTSTSSNNYVAFGVDSRFLTLRSASDSNYADISYLLRSGIMTSRLGVPIDDMLELADHLRKDANAGRLVNLTRDDCIRAYTRTFQSAYRNVLLVSDPDVDRNISDPYLYYGGPTIDNNATDLVTYVLARFYSDYTCGQSQAFSWTCGMNGTVQTGYGNQCDRSCDEPQILRQTEANSTWAPLGPNVHYCLAESTQEECKLQFSAEIAIAVVVLNFVKLTMMLLTVFVAFDTGNDPPLLTVGDAVASFLEKPDHTTKAVGLVSGSEIRSIESGSSKYTQIRQPTRYDARRRRWAKAVSARRWLVCLLLYIAGLATAAGYLGTGLNSMLGSKSLSSLWAIGFGTVSGRTLVQNSAVASGKAGGAGTLIRTALTANIAQLILSLLYFTYNGLFTCMLLANEWDSYAMERKGLRISSTRPRGAQRSKYFLQLPYRFSLPLVLFSLLFHWLVSQSIFVVNITMLDYTGQSFPGGSNNIGHLLTLGYSPIAIIFSIALGGCLILGLISFGFVPFKTGMPIAGSCSISISAACHTDGSCAKGDSESIAKRKLKWGEIAGYWTTPGAAEARVNLTQDLTPTANKKQAVSPAIERGGQQNPPGSGVTEIASLLPSPNAQPKASLDGNEHTARDTSAPPDEDPVVGHCAFSAGPVTMPVQGRLYA